MSDISFVAGLKIFCLVAFVCLCALKWCNLRLQRTLEQKENAISAWRVQAKRSLAELEKSNSENDRLRGVIENRTADLIRCEQALQKHDRLRTCDGRYRKATQ